MVRWTVTTVYSARWQIALHAVTEHIGFYLMKVSRVRAHVLKPRCLNYNRIMVVPKCLNIFAIGICTEHVA